MGGPSRLRWQLTISHLIAIAFTLVSMIAAMLIIGSTWLARQSSQASPQVQDAAIVASTIEGLVVRNADGTSSGAGSVDLSGVLRALATGDLSVQVGPSFIPDQARRNAWYGGFLRDIDYIVVVAPDGHLLGSSDQSGAAFAPPERSQWTTLSQAVVSGNRDPRSLVLQRQGGDPPLLGAYPVLRSNGRPVATVIVATTQVPITSDTGPTFGRALAFFGAASLAVLTASFLFALASSSLVGYLLSRRLVSRLERLGRAAEGFATGDLNRRVEEGAGDEVGQLARQFNRMADQLSATVSELETEKRNAEAALRAKRELVANVSHELRTPLASIRGHTESLLMRNPDRDGDEQREYLTVIHRETENLSRLIDDLFALSRAEAGALPLSLEMVDIGKLIHEVTTSIRPVAEDEKRISLVAQTGPHLPLALADRQRVVQVLGNLIRNALRYTPEGGLIAVTASWRENVIEVAVEDTGMGIPDDQLRHIFERFYRGDAARDRESGGSGLGLAIVRELVEAMGGDARAESIVGQGSRFAFTLPVARM